MNLVLLPPELITQIACYVCLPDLRFLTSCKTLESLSNDSNLWKLLFTRDFYLIPESKLSVNWMSLYKEIRYKWRFEHRATAPHRDIAHLQLQQNAFVAAVTPSLLNKQKQKYNQYVTAISGRVLEDAICHFEVQITSLGNDLSTNLTEVTRVDRNKLKLSLTQCPSQQQQITSVPTYSSPSSSTSSETAMQLDDDRPTGSGDVKRQSSSGSTSAAAVTSTSSTSSTSSTTTSNRGVAPQRDSDRPLSFHDPNTFCAESKCIGVGVVTAFHNLNEWLDGATSGALYNDGLVSHSNGSIQRICPPFGVGDRIGVTVDLLRRHGSGGNGGGRPPARWAQGSTRTISFTLNDKPLGVTYTSLPHVPLFFAVSLRNVGDTVQILPLKQSILPALRDPHFVPSTST